MFYSDYIWKKGSPVGVNPSTNGITYRIISDPYRKWISLEQYNEGVFEKVIYDSQLLDFRKLSPADQLAWQKTTIRESCCLIRNQDDRALFFETYAFRENRCIECKIHSVHGILIGLQKMSYKAFGDPFDGVTLFDSNEHPVMKKCYKTDDIGNFTTLLEENWHLNLK